MGVGYYECGCAKPPSCRYGYTRADLEQLLGDRLLDFGCWFDGQTAAVCDGTEYDPELPGKAPTGCGPHGVVVYPWDVEQFRAGLRPLD